MKLIFPQKLVVKWNEPSHFWKCHAYQTKVIILCVVLVLLFTLNSLGGYLSD